MPRLLTGPIVIATHNPGKLREMRELLAPYGIEAQSAGELGLGEPDETGTSFAANARIKAEAAAHATGNAAFADDSGLSPEQRRAHFIAALCLAWPDGHVEAFEGRVDGFVAWPPRGFLGFGYDPLFQPDGFDRTFGEMTAEEKHCLPPQGQGLSHRARAFVKLAAACLRKP